MAESRDRQKWRPLGSGRLLADLLMKRLFLSLEQLAAKLGRLLLRVRELSKGVDVVARHGVGNDAAAHEHCVTSIDRLCGNFIHDID